MVRKTRKVGIKKSRKTMRGGKRGNMGGNNGYCVKCKTVRSMSNTRNSTTKNGRKMLKGNCPSCKTKMNKFLKS